MSKSAQELLQFAQGMRQFYSGLNATAGEGDAVFAIESVQISVPTPVKFIQGRVYIPTEAPTEGLLPLVLFAHGGCLVSGDLETHYVLVRALAVRLNAVVLSYDYTLAPEQNALQQMQESEAAFNWLYDNADRLKGDVSKIIGVGDSAGGQIIGNLAHTYHLNAARKFAATWLIYPVLSLNLKTESFVKLKDEYFPNSDVMYMSSLCFMPKDASDTDARILPLYANHENLAPTLISIGELDPLSSDSFQYAADLKASNVTHEIKHYPQSQHGFIQYFKNKEAHPFGEQAVEEGIAQLKNWIK